MNKQYYTDTSYNEQQIIEAINHLKKIQKNVIVYQDDIKELHNIIELLKNNKKKLLNPTLFYYNNYIINDLFMRTNYMIGRYRCQKIPTAKRLRSNKHLFQEYDDIMNNYVPTIYDNISIVWKYVSRYTNDDDQN